MADPSAWADPAGVLREGAARVKKGAQGLADRMPVYAQMSQHSAKLIGEPTIKFFSDAKTFLRAELSSDLFYGIDGPTIHYDVYNIETEAMGAGLLWNEGQIPAVDSRDTLLGSIDAYQSLRPVRIGKAGRMPYVLEVNARLKDMDLAPKVRFTGLFTLAANLVGLEELILAVMTRPDRVHALMHFLTHEIVAPWIVCQREHCGSREIATGSDALASPPLITVGMVREFCLQYIQELEKLVGGVRLAGLWGESAVAEPKELLDIKVAGSPGSIQVLDPDVAALGPAFFRDFASRTGVSLVMGIDANLVCLGSVAEIESRARWFIEEGGRDGRFVLFINDIPYDTPPRNVRTVVSAAREYRSDPVLTSYSRKQRDVHAERCLSIEEALGAVTKMLG